MKKIFYFIVLAVLAVGCQKEEILDIPKTDIFKLGQTTISDGTEIYFTLQNAGTYKLTLINKLTNQVLSRETFLGKVGTSGDARGTKSHLHFGISWPTPADTWWVRRGELYPWKYLDAWKAGIDLSPAKAIEALKGKVGEVPPIPKY